MTSREVAEALFFVLAKSQQVVPYRLNRTQELLEEARAAGRRQLVLKARQEGVSTHVDYTYLADCLTVVGTRAVVISHDQDETTELMERVHFALGTIQGSKELVPRHFESRYELSFPLTQSSFKVKTALARVAGRGPTINRLHCSELAFWQDPERTLTGILNTVPKEGWIYLESTGNGAAGYFYDLCQGAMRRENGWVFNFFPWTLDPGYALPLIPGEPVIMTEEEQAIRSEAWVGGQRRVLGPLTPEQVRWRRMMVAQMKGNLTLFRQEYPATPEEAFQMSGQLYFDRGSLLNYKGQAREPLAAGELRRQGREVIFDRVPEGQVFLWEFPKKHLTYLIGADIGEGLADPPGQVTSNTAFQVICRETGRQVAEVDGKVTPQAAADLLISLGIYFNWAILAVEANGPGLATLVILDKEGYPSIYKTRREGQEGQPPTEKLGWHTDKATRPLILSTLRNRLLRREVGLASLGLWQQLMGFLVHIDGQTGKVEYRAAPGLRDDLVLSYAIADYLSEVLPYAPSEEGKVRALAADASRPAGKTGY